MARHFFKVLTIFTGMIALGLLGVYLINYFSFEKAETFPNATACKEGEVC